jgi:hypothetical protein
LIRFFLPLLVLLIGATLAPGMPTEASAETTIRLSTVSNEYPSRLVFRVAASSSTANITDVTLSYSITGRGTSALAKPDQEITPATDVNTDVVVQVNSGASYIPVGSEFKYRWVMTTDDGETFESPEETFFYLPRDQEWESVSNEIMQVWFHGNKQALAEDYLAAGLETWEKVGIELLNAELRVKPVKVVLFDNEAEMDPARPGAGSGSFDAAVTTCGTKVTADIVLVIPVSCGTDDRTDTLRHEFGHIINEAAGEGPLGQLPSWVDEGTAVYAQSTVGDNYLQAFDTGVNRDRLIPFGQMGTPSADAGGVNLFYGQAYQMVLYLIEKEGPETYAEFFATIKRGSRFDTALEETYGFDVAGFEQEFREANGLGSSQQQPTAAPTEDSQQSEDPTARPTERPNQSAGDDDDDGGIGTAPLIVGGLAVVFALLAALSYLASQMLSNSRRTQPDAGPQPPSAPPAGAPLYTPPADDEWSRQPPTAAASPADPPADSAAPAQDTGMPPAEEERE